MLRLWYKTHERRTAETSTSKPERLMKHLQKDHKTPIVDEQHSFSHFTQQENQDHN